MNKNNLNLVGVILCAGEGTRFKDSSSLIPKPLINPQVLGIESILENTIENITSLKLKIKKILIVVGYLAEKIEKKALRLQLSIPDLKERLALIDARPHYKSGPLFSFLEITNHESVFKPKHYYFVIPGDTYFDKESFSRIFEAIESNQDILANTILIFYREILSSKLLKRQAEKDISIIKYGESTYEDQPLKIGKMMIKEEMPVEKIRQVIPFFIFSYELVKKIKGLSLNLEISTLRQSINHLIQKGAKFRLIEIDLEFFDLDYIDDLHKFEKLKKKGRQ